ncbi:GntR family transcriptional regulator [Pseudooceanicola sp. 502str34]
MTAQNSATLDPGSPVPLYQQLYLLLRSQIHGGALRPGDKIMGEAELCEAYDVSRITAKRALNELADTGLVIRKRGSGTRVTDRLPPQPLKASIDGLLEKVGEMGRNTSVRVLSSALMPAPPEIRAALNLPEGARALQSRRVRSLNDQSVSFLEAWIPEEVAEGAALEAESPTPMLLQLERAGISVSSATQTITATLADALSAAALDVPMGAPLIDTRRVVFDAQDRAVEFIRVLYRPELYQIEVAMRRVQGDNGAAWVPRPTGRPEGRPDRPGAPAAKAPKTP